MTYSDNVWMEDSAMEVRNVRGSTHMGGGKPGEYWTRSVKQAIQDRRLGNCPTRVKDYDCANIDCDNNANVAGHVWFDGVGNVHKILLVPICTECNNQHSLRFRITAGTVVVKEQRATLKQTIRSAIKRFQDWGSSSGSDSDDSDDSSSSSD